MSAIRITVKRGKVTQSFVCDNPPKPLPRVGDECTINGSTWFIAKIKSTDIVASFSTKGGKMRQVFP